VTRYGGTLGRLLANAQRAGAVRGDLRADDLPAVVYGGAAVCAAHRSRVRGLRVARLLLDGLRPAAVMKPVVFRDSAALPRHETDGRGMRYCAECGARLRLQQATGRPPRYCGAACRQRPPPPHRGEVVRRFRCRCSAKARA
jgi:hypothetical protein